MLNIIAYYEDVIVGAVCCRLDVDPGAAVTMHRRSIALTGLSSETKAHKLYIMTLGCLAPYRRLHIGAC